MKEEWLPIAGYEGLYEVSNLGNVRGLRKTIGGRIYDNMMIKSRGHCNGYRRVSLRKPGQHTVFYIHRLVAQAFIPNPKNKPFVNHIDGIKVHNSVENLEWNTESENTTHYYARAARIKAENETF